MYVLNIVFTLWELVRMSLLQMEFAFSNQVSVMADIEYLFYLNIYGGSV